ncbi:MAG: RNA polymerase sigma factor region1.1 domain-containing protein, partial [Parasphingorhabdus sp.]
MASKAKNSKAEDEPLIDLNDSAIKKLITKGKKRGYLTIDELNEALPQDQNEQIEDVMSAISEMGVRIVENDEEAAEELGGDEVESIDGKGKEKKTAAAVPKKAAADRTDDPVRMYLREMGAVELLSREGEIAIAKRIEAGRDTMIWGLCESPTTFNAIIEWSTALNDGEMQLREILDLDAMLSKDPVPENLDEEDDDDGEISEKTAGPSFKDDDEVEDEESADGDDDEEAELTERRTKRVVEEEEEDNTLSLAQMEEALKP